MSDTSNACFSAATSSSAARPRLAITCTSCDETDELPVQQSVTKLQACRKRFIRRGWKISPNGRYATCPTCNAAPLVIVASLRFTNAVRVIPVH